MIKNCGKYMLSKKYAIFYLILLFLIARLYLLFAGLESLIPPGPEDNELYRGTTAKMYMDGSINSLLDYQGVDYNGISTVESLASIPFFYIFGPYWFSLKLSTLVFLIATLVLWFLFVKKHIGSGTAVITALLFIFAPPSFISYNLTGGFHSVPLFFDILALTFFFKMIRNTPSPLLVQSSSIEPNISVQATSLNQPKVWWYVLFGIASGFALWVDNVFAITLATCIVFWFIHDKKFFLKRTFVIFVISFFIGFSIWFYYVIYIRHFQIMNIFELSSYYPKLPFYKKFLGTLVYKLPYSFCFRDYFFSGVFLNYLYYAIFVIAFLWLIWSQRKPVLRMLFFLVPKVWREHTGLSMPSQIVTVELLLIGYIVIFILAFSMGRFDVGYKSNSPWDYRFLTPLYPFIFVTIATGLNRLLNIWRERQASANLLLAPLKLISYVFIVILISAGIIGLAGQTSLRDFGKGLKLQGYSFKALVLYILNYNFRSKIPGVESINKLNNIGDNELYKNFLCTQGMYGLVIINKFEPIVCSSLINGINQKFHHNCYEGVGSAYGFLYRDISTLIEKCNSTDEIYKKYAYYGGATSFPVGKDIDKHISAISRIDSMFQPYFYQGLGIQLARRKSLADVERILSKIDETNKKYCCIGIGQNFARRLEWAFADKKYHVGFDGLNKDYWHDCYYGFGWGIGDFFEFDTDRYLAIINNNVSMEYMEYCLNGLSDRLRWKFGSDDKKLQKLLNLIPAVEYFVLEDGTIRFYDKSQRKYLAKGWSFTEEWGTWSEEEESVILVNFAPTLPSPAPYPSPQWEEDGGEGEDYTMLIKATGFSVPGKQQIVKIYLDNNLLGEHTFTHPTTYFEDIEIKIPSAYIKEGNQRIRFVYSFTGVPAEYGMGPDIRQLAMGVSLIEFR